MANRNSILFISIRKYNAECKTLNAKCKTQGSAFGIKRSALCGLLILQYSSKFQTRVLKDDEILSASNYLLKI